MLLQRALQCFLYKMLHFKIIQGEEQFHRMMENPLDEALKTQMLWSLFFRPFPLKKSVIELFSLLEQEWFSQAGSSTEFYLSVPPSMSAASAVVFYFYGHQPPSSTI